MATKPKSIRERVREEEDTDLKLTTENSLQT
jgi:hypothetical protein